jgi:hypothetical protein
MAKLIVDFDDEGVSWYFVVKENGETIHFRPGFHDKGGRLKTSKLHLKTSIRGIDDDEY